MGIDIRGKTGLELFPGYSIDSIMAASRPNSSLVRLGLCAEAPGRVSTRLLVCIFEADSTQRAAWEPTVSPGVLVPRWGSSAGILEHIGRARVQSKEGKLAGGLIVLELSGVHVK